MVDKVDPETGEITESVESRLNSVGHETLDPNPMEIPAGFKRPETLAEQVQRLVRGAVSRDAGEAGFETFEEANDFEIEDDPVDPQTPYEVVFDPVLGRDLTPDEFRRNADVYREQFARATKDVSREDLYAAVEAELGIKLPVDEPLKPAPKVASEAGSVSAADAAKAVDRATKPVHST